MKNATPMNLNRQNILFEYRSLVIRETLANSRNDIQIVVLVDLLSIWVAIIGNAGIGVIGFLIASLLLVLFNMIVGNLFNQLLVEGIDRELADGEHRDFKFTRIAVNVLHLATYALAIIGVAMLSYKLFIIGIG